RTAWIDEIVERRWQGRTLRFRRVVRLVRREADRHGQLLLTPEIEIEGWWTSVELPGEEVAKAYNGRGTSEQFHSEFKTDLNLERLPSGKFRTNALVVALGVVAYNLLRLLGQKVLVGPGAPVRHPAER
ncbi:transposase, partial [Deferrisoma palaeochoriense]